MFQKTKSDFDLSISFFNFINFLDFFFVSGKEGSSMASEENIPSFSREESQAVQAFFSSARNGQMEGVFGFFLSLFLFANNKRGE